MERVSQYCLVNLTSLFLVGASAGHTWRIWGMSSCNVEHSVLMRHTAALFFRDQLLQSCSQHARGVSELQWGVTTDQYFIKMICFAAQLLVRRSRSRRLLMTSLC